MSFQGKNGVKVLLKKTFLRDCWGELHNPLDENAPTIPVWNGGGLASVECTIVDE